MSRDDQSEPAGIQCFGFSEPPELAMPDKPAVTNIKLRKRTYKFSFFFLPIRVTYITNYTPNHGHLSTVQLGKKLIIVNEFLLTRRHVFDDELIILKLLAYNDAILRVSI